MLTLTSVMAQDPQFSQYYQSPLYLNPGFTGITPQQRLVLNNRIQWPNLPQAFTTFAASYDIWVDELKSGFGFQATTDKMGSAGWRTTTASLLYSYKIRLTKKLVFSPGMTFGYGTNGIDRTRLRMGDGIEFDQPSLDPDLPRIGNHHYFDIGSGFLLYSKVFWIGGAIHHMNRPNVSIVNGESRLPMKAAVHAGAKIPLYHGPKTLSRVSYVTPSIIYRVQGPATQLDVGINYHLDPVSIGVWYRGKPFDENYIGTVNQDALIFTMGMYLTNLSIVYSYDFSVSGLSTSAGGAHELSLTYEFVTKPISRAVKKRNNLIPCPTFTNKHNYWRD